MKRTAVVSLIVALTASLFLNIKWFLDLKSVPKFVTFGDANTRGTYETVHHIGEAQKTATGKGIRVGILDKYFGFRKHSSLYSGGKDFVNDAESFEEISEHGMWMATTLKEIAPGVEVFALSVRTGEGEKEADAVVNAINWAIEQKLDVLTYSAQPFESKYREKIDNAVKRAIEHNLVTTFIHYPLPENMLPGGLLPDDREGNSRAPDVRIYHFDYNTLLLFMYEKYEKIRESGGQPRKGDEIPYFSISSTSPVLAGIVAMMMEVRRDLPPDEYKQILIRTAKELEYKGKKMDRVVDAPRALEYVRATTQQRRLSRGAGK